MRLDPSQPIGLARRLAGAPVAVGLAACALLVAPPEVWAQADAVPDPATGTWASTTVALLDYNRELCDGIAGKVVDYWRGLSTSPKAQLESPCTLTTIRYTSRDSTTAAHRFGASGIDRGETTR